MNGRKPTREEELRAEADRLAGLLDMQERALSATRQAWESAREREKDIARIETDALTGDLRADEAESLKAEIVSACSEAEERVERTERVVAELRRRVVAAGEAVIAEMLRVAGEPLGEANRALAAAEALVAEREHASEIAAARFAAVKAESAEVRCAYDPEARAARSAREHERKRLIESLLGFSDATIAGRYPGDRDLLDAVHRRRDERNAQVRREAEETTRSTLRRFGADVSYGTTVGRSEPFPSSRPEQPDELWRTRPAGDGVGPHEVWPQTRV